MNFDVDVRTGEANAFVRTVFSDQLPFATSLSLNRIGMRFQVVERTHMGDIFALRRKRFAERSIKMRPGERATKRSPQVTIRVDAPRGRSDIFAKFETETTKGPFRGRSVAVPTEHVPRTAAGIIAKKWRPAALLKDGTRHGSGKVFQTKGNVFRGKVSHHKVGRSRIRRAAFLIRKPGGRGTIFERDDRELTALYQLVPRVRIDPELNFTDNALRTVRREWAGIFTQAFDQAIATATPGRVGSRRGIFAFDPARAV